MNPSALFQQKITADGESVKSVLVVDNDPETLRQIRQALSVTRWLIGGTADALEAASLLREQRSDVTLLNLEVARAAGIDLLWLLRQIRPRTRIILIAPDGTSDEVIHAIREHAFSYFSKPFEVGPVAEMIVRAAEARDWQDGIEILSARPDWISLRLQCRQLTADRLLQFFRELKTPLTESERDEVATAFRELLVNAIEHGGQFNPNRAVNVSRFRVTNAIIYLIQDPGEGFSLAELPHAAISNPPDSPTRHMLYRAQHGLRAGGFGIMIARDLVDEVVYNETGNEVLLVKYLAQQGGSRQ